MIFFQSTLQPKFYVNIKKKLQIMFQALKEEGHDPDTYVFESLSEGKKTPGKGSKCI